MIKNLKSGAAAVLAFSIVFVSPGSAWSQAVGELRGAVNGNILAVPSVISISLGNTGLPDSFNIPTIDAADISRQFQPSALSPISALIKESRQPKVALQSGKPAVRAARVSPLKKLVVSVSQIVARRPGTDRPAEELSRWSQELSEVSLADESESVGAEPAMRLSGNGLTIAEHKQIINPIIARAFTEGKAKLLEPGAPEYEFYDPQGLYAAQGVRVYVIENSGKEFRSQAKALAKQNAIIAPLDVVAHPSSGKKQVYYFAHQTDVLRRLSPQQRSQIAAHELFHLRNPDLDESEVQEQAPLPKIVPTWSARLAQPFVAVADMALSFKTMLRGDPAVQFLVKKYKKQIFLARALLIVNVALGSAMGYFFGRLIDISGGHLIPHPLVPFFSFFFLTVFSNLLSFIVDRAQVLASSLTAARLVKDVRQHLFAHIASLSTNFFQIYKAAALSPRLSEDVSLLSDKNVAIPIRLPCYLVQFLINTAMLLATNWHIGLLVMLSLPLFAVLTAKFESQYFKTNEKYMDKRSRMIGYAGNIFSIMDVVKIFGIEDKVVERFSASADQLRQVGEERSRMGAWYRVFLNSLGEFSTKILITALGCLGLFFFGQPSVGTIMAMQSYAAGYKGAIQGMSQARVSYADADGGSQRVLDILAMRPEIADAPSAESLGPLHGRIEFKDVSFSYDEKAPVLEHVSFAIEPGQVVAFVGATGSGKSTLMKLMARLHDPTAGSVSVDGRDLKNVRLASLTSQLAVVPQGGGLFKGTIRENLMAVQPNATDKEINEAIDAAQAQFIRDSAGYPHGLDTDIDMLSGGEAQRIAIVRAMLRNPKILFLDEATSALDNKTESLVQQAIDGLMKGRTTVMVAHRLSTIEKADKIFVLDKGRIVESGTHQELMALKGKYYELAATGSK